MSVSNGNIAVVSLGLSCQTSHQLRTQLPALPGHGFAVDAQYFDYIITPFDRLLALLSGDFPILTSPDEITIRVDRPFWASQGLYFAHNFRTRGLIGPIDIPATFAASSARIARLRAKFLALDERSTELIFVIGNGQYDLDDYADAQASRQDLFGFDAERITAIHDALSRRYGARFRRLVVVEGGGSYSGAWHVPGTSRYDAGERTGPRGDVWKGHDGFWGGLLGAELAGAHQ